MRQGHNQQVSLLAPLHVQVGYGELGVAGGLGYEGQAVSVRSQAYPHALSAHAPARLVFDLGGRYRSFHCGVALNDDVRAGVSHAHFAVRADGRLVAQAPYVVAGQPPRPLDADIAGAERLELLVHTTRWEYCHTVWLDPTVSDAPAAPAAATLRDCLDRVEITLPTPAPHADRCIATVVSPGFEGHLDDMLGSLRANGGCPEAVLVAFVVDPDEACRRVAAKHGAVLIRCTPRARVNSTVKAVMYSAASVIDAEQFLCLDADMLVLGDLRPVFDALEVCPLGSILACREANGPCWSNLGHAITHVYGGRQADLARLLGSPNGEAAYSLVVNDGLFAAGRTALLTLEGLIRGWAQAPAWVDERRDVWWRNQFLFNLALARLDCGVELDPTYNLQLNSQDVELRRADRRVEGQWQGRPLRVLHFNGLGRHKYPECRGLFARWSEDDARVSR